MNATCPLDLYPDDESPSCEEFGLWMGEGGCAEQCDTCMNDFLSSMLCNSTDDNDPLYLGCVDECGEAICDTASECGGDCPDTEGPPSCAEVLEWTDDDGCAADCDPCVQGVYAEMICAMEGNSSSRGGGGGGTYDDGAFTAGCEPCEGADGCGNFYDQGECEDLLDCYWLGNAGPGCRGSAAGRLGGPCTS